ncbi:hypothetical protein CPB85DRAFT_1560572 [Mucidula mucida]|nr:hypothetical protein CPB85DRAFT_1560572 [Mucidula mucida]
MSFARRMPPFIAGLIGVGSGLYIFYPSVQQLQAPSHPQGMAQDSQPPPSTTDSVAMAIQSDHSPSGPKSESPSSKRA